MSTTSATPFQDPADPKDFLDYIADFSSLLETAETINAGTFTVVPSTNSALLGFEISTVFIPVLISGNQMILFWSFVNESNREDAVFDDEGIQAELTITFTSSSSRIFERSFLIRIKQL